MPNKSKNWQKAHFAMSLKKLSCFRRQKSCFFSLKKQLQFTSQRKNSNNNYSIFSEFLSYFHVWDFNLMKNPLKIPTKELLCRGRFNLNESMEKTIWIIVKFTFWGFVVTTREELRLDSLVSWKFSKIKKFSLGVQNIYNFWLHPLQDTPTVTQTRLFS